MASQAKHREAGNLACLSWCLDTRSPAGVAVESGVAVVVTTAGGNGKFPAIFLATPHVPARIYAMLPAEFQPAAAGSGVNIKLSVCSLLKIKLCPKDNRL